MLRLFKVGLLVVVAGAATPASADTFADCATFTWAAQFGQVEPDFLTMKCQELTRGTAVGVSFRVVQDTQRVDSAAADFQAAIVTATAAALTKYSAVGPPSQQLHNVTIALDAQKPPKVSALATTWSGDGKECLIAVRTQTSDFANPVTRAARLPIVVAHELFHCIQQWNAPAQVAVDKPALWWLEGSADAMSLLVYDDQPNLQLSADGFAQTPKPFTQFKYETWVFFNWLSNLKGPSAILDFVLKMPTSGGETEQRAAMLSAVTLLELQQFARDWVDGVITTPQGWSIKAPELTAHQLIFSSSETKAVETQPFGVLAQLVSFRNGVYSLESVKPPTPAPTWATHPQQWRNDPPIATGVPCGNGQPVTLAAFITEPAPDFSIKATHAADGDAPLPDHDSCLAGSWSVDIDAETQQLKATVPNIDTGKNITVAGDITLDLDSKGAGKMSFNSFVATFNTTTPNAAFIFEYDGAIEGGWSNSGGTFRLCPTSDTVGIKTTTFAILNGNAVPNVVYTDGAQVRDLTYTCSGNRLTLSPKALLQGDGGTGDEGSTSKNLSWRFTRVGTNGAAGCSTVPSGLVLVTTLAALAHFRRRRPAARS